MQKTLITIVQLVVFVGLGVFLIYWKSGQLSASDKEQLIASIKAVHLWFLAPVFVVFFLSHFFRALRWKLLLQPLNIRPTNTNTTSAVLIGYLANLLLPRMGEVAKCTVLARYEHVPVDKIVGTIVVERIFDVVCLGIITLATFTLQAGVIGQEANNVIQHFSAKGNTFLILGIIAIVGLVALILIYRKIKTSKVGHFIKGMGDGVKSIFQLKQRGLFLLYSFLIWLMYLLTIYLGFLGMDETMHLTPVVGLVVLVFGSVGMIVTQGGIGAYPIVVGKTLQSYGLTETSGLAFGWVSWMVQTGIIIILGLIALVVLPLYNRKSHHAQTGLDTTQDIQ
jgi:glycosyltransferase 2 family protein